MTTPRALLARPMARAAAALLVAAAAFVVQAAPPPGNVAWLAAQSDADIERAFARAKGEKKPVLLYWGAAWCPPCNQLNATLFNRQDFAALATSFVPVHVDGDRPGAQKLGQRFKVVGYPTMVLMDPAGQELTRLPGEADAPEVMAVLQLGLAAGRPAKAVLADALSGKPVSSAEWRLLAFYGWDIDEQQLVPKSERPGLLARLAAASAAGDAPAAPELTTRLWLKALAASDDGQGVKADDALRLRVRQVLADARAVRAQTDVLANSAADIVRTLEPDDSSPRRAPLVAAFEAALKGLEADATLSRADRLQAVISRIELARLALPKGAVQVALPAPLLADLREHVARADREITDGYERQAVITGAAYALGRAGLWADSDALLRANLAKSHSPYYLMSQLGGNARKLGKKDEALGWFAQAFDKSEGSATRLQWGSGYLVALIELAPGDAPRIEKTAAQLLREAAADSGAFEGRSVRSLQRAAGKLAGWNTGGRHAATLGRLQTQLDAICARRDVGDRAECTGLLIKPAAKRPATG